MDDISRFDDTLFGILKDCRTVPTFLDSVFGFLNRRTDFYITATSPRSPVGLPPGVAETLVKSTFYKWKPKDLSIEGNVPEAVTEAIIETTLDEVTTDLNKTTVESHAEIIEEVAEKEKEVDFAASECYNGASYENYTWSQTITELDVIVKVPQNITTKNLSVQIQAQKISIKLKNEGITLLEGSFCQKCKHNDAIWSLNSGKLEIHLEKAYEMWWNCFLQSEPKLDVAKLDCSRPFDELPDEAQAKIQELTWNQERKRLGLPTSDEIKMHEQLRKAWTAKGSPFKEPYDPNTVVFN